MEIEDIRKKIDTLDHHLLDIIAKRFKLVKEIGLIKKQKGLQATDKEREQFMMKDRAAKLNSLGYNDEKFISDLFNLIISKSKSVQNEKND